LVSQTDVLRKVSQLFVSAPPLTEEGHDYRLSGQGSFTFTSRVSSKKFRIHYQDTIGE